MSPEGLRSNIFRNSVWWHYFGFFFCIMTLFSIIFCMMTLFFVFYFEVYPALIVCYCHATYPFQIKSTLYSLWLTNCQGTPCSKQALYLNFKWQQPDSNNKQEGLQVPYYYQLLCSIYLSLKEDSAADYSLF